MLPELEQQNDKEHHLKWAKHWTFGQYLDHEPKL